ncbi:hypothetical protein BURMUCGD1_3485 [Burkholderia multivorans CGD1]|nr:hypothetical protein BURMUCGD1_3485 [Burkholderia multivorans CGD1]
MSMACAHGVHDQLRSDRSRSRRGLFSTPHPVFLFQHLGV